VLDHLIGACDTALDRGESNALKLALLRRLDTSALGSADIVVVDTEEHRGLLDEGAVAKTVVVPVGAEKAWFTAGDRRLPAQDGRRLTVVFFGLFTPLQGAIVIGKALGLLRDSPIEVTMIGEGQDYAAARAAGEANQAVRWIPWVEAASLPEVVARHDVCLGIFGTTTKALRVVPNKVYQGAAVGCAVVTSDTFPQRRALGDAALFVPPGDHEALARTLLALANDRESARALGCAAKDRALSKFSPREVVRPLLSRIDAAWGRRDT
jgi:glycosyltransferase involved in cell wall biosynthesis